MYRNIRNYYDYFFFRSFINTNRHINHTIKKYCQWGEIFRIDRTHILHSKFFYYMLAGYIPYKTDAGKSFYDYWILRFPRFIYNFYELFSCFRCHATTKLLIGSKVNKSIDMVLRKNLIHSKYHMVLIWRQVYGDWRDNPDFC